MELQVSEQGGVEKEKVPNEITNGSVQTQTTKENNSPSPQKTTYVPNTGYSPNKEDGSSYKRGDKDYPAGDVSGKRKKSYYGRRVSYFVKNPDAPIDYKRVDILVKFISAKGKIIPRRFTGLSALHQRRVAKAIKRARHAGLLPYSLK